MAYPNDGDPIRLRCLTALEALLSGIRVSAGFHHDMRYVTILQSEKLASGPATPAAVIVDDGLDERVAELTCQVEQAMPLSIFLVVRAAGGAPGQWVREISWLLSDVVKALGDDVQLGGVATYVDMTGMHVYESPLDAMAAAELKVRIVYRHLNTDPAAITGV